MRNTMSMTSNPALERSTGPGMMAISGLNLSVLTVLVVHLVTSPGVLSIIAGFIIVVTLPVVLAIFVVRAVETLVTMADDSMIGPMTIPDDLTPDLNEPTD